MAYGLSDGEGKIGIDLYVIFMRFDFSVIALIEAR